MPELIEHQVYQIRRLEAELQAVRNENMRLESELYASRSSFRTKKHAIGVTVVGDDG